MKKKGIIVLVFAVIVAGGAFAQDKTWYNSYAPGIEGSKLLVNAVVRHAQDRYAWLHIYNI